MPNFGEVDRLWFQCYIAISRANNAIRAIQEAENLDNKEEKLGVKRVSCADTFTFC
jgi:hypothetical protein